MAKHGSVTWWKAKAWKMCSTYIRRRDAFKNEETGEYAICCTCKKVYHYKKLQAGHFLPRRRNGALFDERNIHAQCYSCNMHMGGNPVKYFRFMQKEYGEEVIQELEAKNELIKQFTVEKLEEVFEEFKAKLKALG